MIVVDTNVVSEVMRPRPDPVVQAWLNEQTAETLYLASVSVAEILFGIAMLPTGKNKARLSSAFEGILGLFDARVLPFNARAARYYAELAATARDKGQGLPVPDGYIAAVAAAQEFKVASRDTAPFEAAGVSVIDPWHVKCK